MCGFLSGFFAGQGAKPQESLVDFKVERRGAAENPPKRRVRRDVKQALRSLNCAIWMTTKKRLSTYGGQSLFIKMHNSSLALFFIQQILQGTQNRIGT